MALPLSDMLKLARGDDDANNLPYLQTQEHEAATYLLNHAEGLLLDETVTGRVIVAELAVFETRPGDDQARQFATFAAARAEDQLESYLNCIKAIQTITEDGGPLVLMDDFYQHKEAFLSTHEPKASSGRQAAVARFVGKFDTPRSQLSDKDRQALKRIPPKRRFDYFATRVANDFCAEQWLSISAVTLDCRSPRASNIRASLFVVLGHESDRSTIDAGLRSLISQRTYKLLGSLVAGNLLQSWAIQDNSPIERAKKLIFPHGAPHLLGYRGTDFKAFFEDEPQGGPPHNHDDDPSSELHPDVRQYFARIFENCQSVDEWAKRPGQAHEMHEVMKQIWLMTKDLTFNWLPVLAASCLDLDGVESDDNRGVKLFNDSKLLSKLPEDRRREFAEALLEFFAALRPKYPDANPRIEVKCLKDFFEVQVRPFDARNAGESRVALLQKVTDNIMEPKSHGGDLTKSIDKIHRYLRLSGLQVRGKEESKQLCVLHVIPSTEAGDHSCKFRFQAVSSTPGGVS